MNTPIFLKGKASPDYFTGSAWVKMLVGKATLSLTAEEMKNEDIFSIIIKINNKKS